MSNTERCDSISYEHVMHETLLQISDILGIDMDLMEVELATLSQQFHNTDILNVQPSSAANDVHI